jgi:hypothetical protein
VNPSGRRGAEIGIAPIEVIQQQDGFIELKSPSKDLMHGNESYLAKKSPSLSDSPS